MDGAKIRLVTSAATHSRHFHTPSEETRHGTRYVVDGPLNAPDGTVLRVRSAWYIDPNGDAPRFVTAHPLPKL